jgi:hypothetical protein
MKIPNVLTLILVAGPALWAANPAVGGSSEIVICMDRAIDPWVILRAQSTASRMFGEIGLLIDWRSIRNCPDVRDITVELRVAAQDHQPGALAEAFPYEGIHIHVFYNRIQSSVEPKLVAQVLAHVLVHEVTHVLEGVTRHSETGVMKAHWDAKDYTAMSWGALAFAPEDIILIRYGLDERNRRHKAERSMIAIESGTSSVLSQ